MKRDKSVRKVFIYSFIAIVLIFAFLFRGVLKYEAKLAITTRTKASGGCYNCDQYFQDNVKTHELAYKKEGIKPQKEVKQIEDLKNQKKLVELTTNENYSIREMEHSVPYVLPKVKTFLDSLVVEYKNQLDAIEYVPFEITSATRSKRTVKDLMGGNVNAIPNSAHLKGKTIDISYKEFGDKKEQSICFVKALKKLHDRNKCYVKFEKTGCLHITVR